MTWSRLLNYLGNFDVHRVKKESQEFYSKINLVMCQLLLPETCSISKRMCFELEPQDYTGAPSKVHIVKLVKVQASGKG